MRQRCPSRRRKAIRVEFFCFVKKEKDCLFLLPLAGEGGMRSMTDEGGSTGLTLTRQPSAATLSRQRERGGRSKPREKMREAHQAFGPRPVAGICIDMSRLASIKQG